ncbi:MAG: DNA polymerase III subunit beta [Firmicutes bacterium]|nr:DNA polymerase III subunit beta [Bacillota bacterium]
MKILCTKDALLDGLNLVGRTVSARTTMPILECVLLTADEDGIRLTASNGEMSIETDKIPATVEEPGRVALEAKLLTEIVRKMSGDAIAIEITDSAKNETVCKSGKAKFTIMGMPADEFPQMPNISEFQANASYKISATEIRDMIKQTIFSVAADDTKPILTGELIQHRENALNIVAVDGFRIAYRKMELPAEQSAKDEPISVVVPGKALNELSRILPSAEKAEKAEKADKADKGEKSEKSSESDMVNFYFTDKRIIFVLPQFTFVSNLIVGEFIRYDQIFNDDFTTNITIDRQEFLRGLERATLVARENKKSPVKLEITEQSVNISCNTEMGNSYDEISANVDGNTLNIAFNPRYLMEALRALPDEQIKARFTTELSPCILTGIENDSAKYLILPLRLFV